MRLKERCQHALIRRAAVDASSHIRQVLPRCTYSATLMLACYCLRGCLRPCWRARTLPKKAKTSSARKRRKPGDRSRSSRGQPIDADVEREALLKLFHLTSPSRPYSGQLKDPIVRASKLELMLRGGPEQQERLGREEDARIVAEQFGKLFLLLDHFKIPRRSHLRWFHLAFRLARQHVRGMEVVEGALPKKGPKGRRKGTPTDHELLIALTQVKLERKRGTADAIRTLRKRQPDVWHRFSAKSLQHRYSKLRKELVPYPKGDLIDNLAAMFGLSARYRKPENSET